MLNVQYLFFSESHLTSLAITVFYSHSPTQFQCRTQNIKTNTFRSQQKVTLVLTGTFSTMRTLSSVQFSRSVVSDSLRPHGLQHARRPCPSPTRRVYSNSCPFSQQCHPTISTSVVPFSHRLKSFPAWGSFLMSQLFASGGQSIGASASVLPMNIQGWFPLGLTGFICLLSKGLPRVLSSTTVQKHQLFCAQLSL